MTTTKTIRVEVNGIISDVPKPRKLGSDWVICTDYVEVDSHTFDSCIRLYLAELRHITIKGFC